MTWPDPTDVGDVYQPAEDSHLLATAAREAAGPGDAVLDVGTGSGYVAGTVAETGARVVASDVNPHACRQADREYGSGSGPDDRRTAGDSSEGGADPRPVAVMRADLTAPFDADAFDLVTFNPPYLPTDPEDRRDDWMARALSGGPSGRAVVERFLGDVGRVLAPDGSCLLLASTLAGVDEVAQRAGQAGFHVAAVTEESFPFETLTVLKLFR